jgi:hypothetical protein
MKDKETNTSGCPIVDAFVGQGAAVSGNSRQSRQTPTVGCAILTEFTGQGQPTKRAMQPAAPAEAPQSPSQGCETITIFTDEGISVAAEQTNGAGVAQPQPNKLV